MEDLTLKERLDQLYRVPGHVDTFTPEEAEELGAFTEDALSLKDAEEAMIDLYEDNRSI